MSSRRTRVASRNSPRDTRSSAGTAMTRKAPFKGCSIGRTTDLEEIGKSENVGVSINLSHSRSEDL